MAPFLFPTVVDKATTERQSPPHPVTTAISAVSQVDEDHQMQAFLCYLVVEASQVAAVKWSVEGNRITVSSSTVLCGHILCSGYSITMGSCWVIFLHFSIEACFAPTPFACCQFEKCNAKAVSQLSVHEKEYMQAEKKEAYKNQCGMFMEHELNSQISWMCIEAKCEVKRKLKSRFEKWSKKSLRNNNNSKSWKCKGISELL